MIYLVFLTATSFAATNSNVCLSLLPPTSGCINSNPSAACCTALKNFNAQKCFCNSLTNYLINPANPTMVTTAKTKCGIVDNCAGFGSKTYNSGTCKLTDDDIDFARYKAGMAFATKILSFGTQPGCFNYTTFRTSLNDFMRTTTVARAGQGLGVYSGIDAIAEYFSLLAPQVNRGFLAISPAANPNPLIYVSATGANVTLGVNVVNKYFNNAYQTSPTDYLEMIFNFNACDTKTWEVFVPPVATLKPGVATGVPSMARMLHLAVNFPRTLTTSTFNYIGIRSICSQHKRFCTGANSQFVDMSDCVNFLRSLPNTSPACGKAALVSGNTITCRAKHQFMVQISPEVHCPHLGKVSEVCNEKTCEYPGDPSMANDSLNIPTDLQTAIINANAQRQDAQAADYCF